MYNVVVIATHMQCYEVKVLYVFKLHLLDRLEAIACRADLSFSPDVFFFPSRDLRDAWADRREILHDGQYWAEFYNTDSKFRGRTRPVGV